MMSQATASTPQAMAMLFRFGHVLAARGLISLDISNDIKTAENFAAVPTYEGQISFGHPMRLACPGFRITSRSVHIKRPAQSLVLNLSSLHLICGTKAGARALFLFQRS